MADPLQAFMEQNKGLLSFEPTEEDRKKAMTYGLIGAGLGILSANAHNPRGAGFGGAVGGALPGLQMYQQTLQNAPKERMQNLGGMLQLRNLQTQLKRDEALSGMQFDDPAARQFAAAGMFKEAIQRQNPEQKYTGVGTSLLDITPGKVPTPVYTEQPKPQLVNMPVPGQPGITQPTWLRPGEASGVSVGGMNMPDILNPAVQAAKRDVAKAGASNVFTKVDLAQETEENKAIGKELGQQYADIQKGGTVAGSKIEKFRRMSQLAEGINTGKLAPAIADVSAIADSLGVKIDRNLGSKQALEALSNEVALSLRGTADGGGMPGAMSDKDREFLKAMTPGLAKTPEGNKLIIESGIKLAQRQQEIAKKAREYRAKNRTLEGFSEFMQKYADENPLFGDSAPSNPRRRAGDKIDAILEKYK